IGAEITRGPAGRTHGVAKPRIARRAGTKTEAHPAAGEIDTTARARAIVGIRTAAVVVAAGGKVARGAAAAVVETAAGVAGGAGAAVAEERTGIATGKLRGAGLAAGPAIAAGALETSIALEIAAVVGAVEPAVAAAE